MDITALRNLTYGLYVVGTNDNGRPTGCIINTCFQVTSENPIVAISMNKNNYTHDIIVRHGKFSLAILAEESDTSLITTAETETNTQITIMSGKTMSPSYQGYFRDILSARYCTLPTTKLTT